MGVQGPGNAGKETANGESEDSVSRFVDTDARREEVRLRDGFQVRTDAAQLEPVHCPEANRSDDEEEIVVVHLGSQQYGRMPERPL